MSGFEVSVFRLPVCGGPTLFVKCWLPKDNHLKGIVQIAHGMRESAGYYDEFCEALSRKGYGCVVHDARGHGQTAGNAGSPEFKENAGNPGPNGISQMVDDLKAVTDKIKAFYPSEPVFLLGHSMGSILSRIYVSRYGGEIDGLIYSGTTGPLDHEKSLVLLHTALEECSRRGSQSVAVDTPQLLFGHFNDRFEPVKTGFEYMSRDETMVNEAIRSPYADVPYRCGFYLDFLKAMSEMDRKEAIEEIPKLLPILSISGDMDPFGDYGIGIKRLFALYRQCGIKDAGYILYKGGRHEMLRETNRSEVFEDIIRWLDKHTVPRTRSVCKSIMLDSSTR